MGLATGKVAFDFAALLHTYWALWHLEIYWQNTRQAARVLNQNKTVMLADVAETKKEEGQQLIDNLNQGLQDFQNIIEQKDRAAVAPKQKELLHIVGE